MSVIRATIILSTTNNNIELTKNIRDTVRDLCHYCQRQHTAAHPDHRCSIELAKGPMVPAIDIPDRVLSHLSNAQQAHFEPLHKAREEINGIYNSFTSAGVNGSMALRLINSNELKEVDSKGVKAWLASFETLEGEPGKKSNADKLYLPNLLKFLTL